MSLIPGNIEVAAFAYQADKDTPADAPTIAVALEDCQLDPNVTFITLAESDAAALEGDDVVVGAGPGGTLKKYLRPNEEDFFLYGLIGSVLDDPTDDPVFGHTSDIDAAAPFFTPYLTCWDIWPGIATIRYTGVRIAKAVYSGQAGGPWEAEYTFMALKATFEAQPDLTGLLVDELPFTWPDVRCSLGGVHDGIVNRAQLTIDRKTGYFSGDNGLVALDCPNGLASVMGNAEVAFQDDLLYRAANTGATDGDELTTTVFSESVDIDLQRGTDRAKFSLADAQIKNYKVDLKNDGSPAVATFDFKSRRSATLADFIQTLVRNAADTADRT